MKIIVNIDDEDFAQIMIIEREGLIIPVNPLAFHVSQSTKKKLNEAYKGALIVSRTGLVRVIQHIDQVGFGGNSFGRKIVSALSGAHKIEIKFGGTIQMSLDDFKNLIVRFIESDSKSADPYLPQKRSLDEVFVGIKNAGSFEEVFNEINMPDLQDCLDVL